MLRHLVLTLAALSPGALNAAESFRQFSGETSTPLAEIVTHLEQRLPDSVQIMELEGEAGLHYVGKSVPPVLAGFLETAFPRLDPTILTSGQAVTLTVGLQEMEAGTHLTLMALAEFPSLADAVPSGATVLLDGTGPGTCEGQIVAHSFEPVEEAAITYRTHLEQNGFVFPEDERQSASFFFGHAPGCDVALYLQSESDTTVAVIRYLEE